MTMMILRSLSVVSSVICVVGFSFLFLSFADSISLLVAALLSSYYPKFSSLLRGSVSCFVRAISVPDMIRPTFSLVLLRLVDIKVIGCLVPADFVLLLGASVRCAQLVSVQRIRLKLVVALKRLLRT